MARNYGFSSSDEDFDLQPKKIFRPKYDSDEWNFNFSADEASFMRRDSDGDLIIVPGQSDSKNVNFIFYLHIYIFMYSQRIKSLAIA